MIAMKANRQIRVAIAGLGNCASALIQAVYREKQKAGSLRGVMHRDLGGYSIADIVFVAAFDVDTRKVGKDISEAVFAGPNCTEKISDIPYTGVLVSPGPFVDGVANHMKEDFSPIDYLVNEEEVVAVLKKSGAEILLNYMPVGADKDSGSYGKCAIKAGCAFINCMPAFICSNKEWIERFRQAGLPCIGDDVKSQLGASVIDRTILHLFDMRGAEIEEASQYNSGNNTDFRNMQDVSRLETKFKSKTNTCISNISQPINFDLKCNGIDVGLRGDHKVCDIRIRAIATGGEVIHTSRTEVVDSYNSAGVVLDAIRVAKVALKRGLSGPILPACACFMKSPPEQMEDNFSNFLLEEWIADESRTIVCSHSRLQDFSYSGQKYSEFWTRSINDLVENARKHHLKIEVMSPRKHYHDEKEYLQVIEEAIQKLLGYPQGYVKNLVIPFSITDPSLRKKMIDMLKLCEGINIYGINVAPDEEFVSQVPNICGYAGMDEPKVGDDLYNELVSRADVSTVMVVRHQKNQGLEWRIESIKRLAEKDGKKVLVFGAHEQRQIKKYVNAQGVGIITLGCRGTEIILGFKTNRNTPIVCMDNNNKVEAFLRQMNVSATCYSQDGFYGDVVFSGMFRKEMTPQKVMVVC